MSIHDLFVFPSCDDGEFDLGWEHAAAVRKLEWHIKFHEKRAVEMKGTGYPEQICHDGIAQDRRILTWLITCTPGDVWLEYDNVFCVRADGWTGNRMSIIDGKGVFVGKHPITGEPLTTTFYGDCHHCGYLNPDDVPAQAQEQP